MITVDGDAILSKLVQQLIPEWHASEAVILAWPDEQTDWATWLDDVRNTYVTLIGHLHDCRVTTLLLCRSTSIESAKTMIPPNCRVLTIDADFNDTWVRDYGFLTVRTDDGPTPLEFTFNGWGNKFDARKDNAINHGVLSKLCNRGLISASYVVEGGALEINEQGHLLSTQLCLTNPQRNGNMTLTEYQTVFEDSLGATKFTALEHGHLEGDDTDGHIDTLVRFTPENNLVIQSCFNRPEDTHYSSLQAMVIECKSHFPDAECFELPLCELYNKDGERLPASYANFLICNGTVLVPIYGEKEDATALSVIEQAYPQYEVKGVNCRSLINQFGSLHCISMQVPRGTLKTDILSLASEGVFHYAP